MIREPDGKDRKTQDNQEWIKVGQVSSLAEGEIVQSALESACIDVNLRHDAASSVILGPGSVNIMSGVEIWVPENQKKEAQKIIQKCKD